MGTETPIADLGGALRSLLLSSLVWVALAALLAGAAGWILASRKPSALDRVREILLGTPLATCEPRPRRFLRLSFGLLWIADGLLQAQPKMPGGFLVNVVDPGVASGPSWFAGLVAPFARAWTRHPVAADAATVWVQVGLGLLILMGGRGLLRRIALWGSIVWSLAVWVVGEAFGGLLASGASWLSGAPGAVLIYVPAAALLLAPDEWWDSGRAGALARRFVAGWLLLGAAFQALPFERQWSAGGLAEHFAAAARTPQPGLISRPIARLASVSAAHPAAVNSVIIVVLVAAAAALFRSGRTAVVITGLVVCALTWWLGQDFGVFGGTSTDPNAALPLGLLLACSLTGWTATEQRLVQARPARPQARRIRAGAGAGLAALAAGLTFVVPVALVSTLGTAADAAAVAADSDGGVRRIPTRPAADFTLTDQHGKRVSTASLRGKLVLLTFLDPVCTTDCPLVANQLAIADRELGPLAQQVEFVAVDTNPVFHFVSDVDAFTQSHGLGGYANWHFLCGPPVDVGKVLDAYGISVDVPAVGMIQHSEGMYFIAADGRQAAYLNDGAGEQLTRTYAEQVRDEIRSLLK